MNNELLAIIGKGMDIMGQNYRQDAIMARKEQLALRQREWQKEDQQAAHTNRKEIADLEFKNRQASADYQHGLAMSRDQAKRDADKDRFSTEVGDDGVTYQVDNHTKQRSILRDPAKLRGKGSVAANIQEIEYLKKGGKTLDEAMSLVYGKAEDSPEAKATKYAFKMIEGETMSPADKEKAFTSAYKSGLKRFGGTAPAPDDDNPDPVERVLSEIRANPGKRNSILEQVKVNSPPGGYRAVMRRLQEMEQGQEEQPTPRSEQPSSESEPEGESFWQSQRAAGFREPAEAVARGAKAVGNAVSEGLDSMRDASKEQEATRMLRHYESRGGLVPPEHIIEAWPYLNDQERAKFYAQLPERRRGEVAQQVANN